MNITTNININQVSDWTLVLPPAHRGQAAGTSDGTTGTAIKIDCGGCSRGVDVKLVLLTVFAKPSSLEPIVRTLAKGWGVGQTLISTQNVRWPCKATMLRFAAAHTTREWSLASDHSCLRRHVGAAPESPISLPQATDSHTSKPRYSANTILGETK